MAVVLVFVFTCNKWCWWWWWCYLSSMCQPVSVNPSRRYLRSAARGDLVVPATKRTVCYGPRSFAVAGPATWNSLPASLRDDQLSVPAFRRLLKTELFTRAYDSSLASSWLSLTVRVGEHNFNYYYYCPALYGVCMCFVMPSTRLTSVNSENIIGYHTQFRRAETPKTASKTAS